MKIYAKVSKKGQITIPKPIRERLKLGKNSAVLFMIEGCDVVIKGVPFGSAESLAGSLRKFARIYESLDKIRPEVQEEIGNKYKTI
jgi:AbrB family looped-hinge helix DNA binding protein